MKGAKIIRLALSICLVVGLLAGCSNASSGTAAKTATYPTDEIKAVVQWGEGGGTDTVLRPLAELAQDELGVTISVSNMAGSSGALATEYVYDANADGYTLLFGAENPQLYKELELSDLTYSDFIPIIIVGDEIVGVAVAAGSQYSSVTELIDAALAQPDTIKVATTGEGGLPWTATSFLTSITGATFDELPYNSDAEAEQAVLDGSCDFTICKVQAGLTDYQVGKLSFLAMLSNETVEKLEDVPLITEEYPAFSAFLPWGPFYGVFVRINTDQEIVDTLTKAFTAAYEDASYQEMLESIDITPMGLTGDEAVAYLEKWQTETLSSLEQSGALDET